MATAAFGPGGTALNRVYQLTLSEIEAWTVLSILEQCLASCEPKGRNSADAARAVSEALAPLVAPAGSPHDILIAAMREAARDSARDITQARGSHKG